MPLCVLLTAGFAGLYALTRWRARRAETRWPPEGRFVDVDGLRLHYVRRKPSATEARPTIVLLHGSEGFWQDFAGVIERLDARYDVIAWDRPGHGYSDTPDPRFAAPDAQADLLHRALIKLGVDRPVLVGYSWSGALLMAYALKYPGEAAGLTLIAGWLYAPDTLPLWLLRVPEFPLLGPLLTATLPVLLKGPFMRHHLRLAFAPHPVPAEYARLTAGLWQRNAKQARFFARENLADRAVMRALVPRYAELTLPIVLLSGEQDREVPPARHALRLQAALPHAHLILLPDEGHALPQTRPDAVADAIERCCALVTGEEREQKTEDRRQKPDVEGWSVAVEKGLDRPEAQYDRQNDKDDVKLRDREDDSDRARELVMRYGWNAMCYQLLAPDMEHWFTREGNAVVGFARRSGVRVVAGGPVCALENLAAAVEEFEQDARSQSETVCYFGAAERMDALLRGLPDHDRVAIGAQPVWNPAHWPDITRKNSSLRAQINRARNKGAAVAEWTPERARDNAALQRCLDEWMATHPFPPLHFLTEAVPLNRLRDRRLFVSSRRDEPVAFLIATPIPDRRGWLIEQIVRGQNAPNGTVELLIDAMMRTFGDEGSDYITLGLAPLSSHAGSLEISTQPWLRLLLGWVRAHGQRFYNFDGLDAFKAKFRPDRWEPLYAISSEARFSPRTLYAIAAAFSDGPPVVAVSRGLLAAVKQELVWFRARLHKKS